MSVGLNRGEMIESGAYTSRSYTSRTMDLGSISKGTSSESSSRGLIGTIFKVFNVADNAVMKIGAAYLFGSWFGGFLGRAIYTPDLSRERLKEIRGLTDVVVGLIHVCSVVSFLYFLTTCEMFKSTSGSHAESEKGGALSEFAKMSFNLILWEFSLFSFSYGIDCVQEAAMSAH
jgi:hypothetical protein